MFGFDLRQAHDSGVIRALSLEFARMETLTVGNVAQIDDIPIIYAISMTCWRRERNWGRTFSTQSGAVERTAG
jgi:hypothetical protein